MDIQQIQDELRSKEPNPLAKLALTKEIGDVKFTVNVSPCSWLYPNHGFQIEVQMIGSGSIVIHDPSIKFAEATVADVHKLFNHVRVVNCSRCGSHAFDPSAVDTNRHGLCEKCFTDDINKEFKEIEQNIKRRDERYRKKGYTHKLEAWIHPAGGGDDFDITLYFSQFPSEQAIQSALRKYNSMVENDYRIVPL